MKSDTLQISATLLLPLEAATQTFGTLGRRGTCKTNTAVPIEEMIRARLPNVILDPVTFRWGLRSSKDGPRKELQSHSSRLRVPIALSTLPPPRGL
jgi:hypothetical protein